jgi:peptidoglycan hydrolase-like protein with peptidoglycan-binding domain
MKKMILAINPKARVEIHCKQWQLAGDALKRCEVIVGGLDNVRGKDELDAFCRRFLIPYIDQGMDVHKLGHGHLVAGQVVLSEPGSPCLRCMGIVTDAALAEESRKDGAAGGRPQAVWSNGVLASLAVGLVVQMVTPWSRRAKPGAYLSYDGNSGLVTEAERFRRWSASCTHYPNAAVGDTTFDIRKFMASETKAGRRGHRWGGADHALGPQDAAAINNAELGSQPPAQDKIDAVTVKVQVLIDRAQFSPGEIDGKLGENAQKALRAFAEANSLAADKPLTLEIWTMLSGTSTDPVIAEYTLTENDVKGPFLKKLPAKMEAMKDLKTLSYTSPRQAIAEKFHIGPVDGSQQWKEIRSGRGTYFRYKRPEQASQAHHRPDRGR